MNSLNGHLSCCVSFAVHLFVVLGLSVMARGADFFVAPNGDDENHGTREKPFATIRRAQQAVRALKAKQPERSGPIVIEIAGGNYELAEPIAFTPEDSSTESAPVIYRAAEGAQPVFSGGRRIDGWQVGEDGIWRVFLEAVRRGEWRFRELFVNGTRATRARHPDNEYLRVEQVGPDRRTSFMYQAGDIPDASLDGSPELVFLHDWSISRVRIKSINPTTRILTTAFTVGPHARHYVMDHYEKHPRYFLENALSFLDQPGEWYLNENTGELHYKPRPGEKPENVIAVAPKLDVLLTVRGTERQPARHLTVEGLTFEHCAFMPGGRYAAGQAGFHEEDDTEGPGHLRMPIPPAVHVERAEHFTLRKCTVRHVGRAGVWIGSRCTHSAVLDSIITDTAGNGLNIGEDRSRRIDGKYWWQVAPDQAANHIRVSRNLVEYCGREYYGAVGVWVGMANQVVLSHNEVRYTPYTGITVGWMWNPTPTPCHHVEVRANHIHHVMQVLSDGGGIYTLGRQPGTVLSGNAIHDVPQNAGRAESNGMFLDEGTTGIVIEDNVIYNTVRSPLRFHKAGRNIVRNNVMWMNEGVPLIRYNNTDPNNIEKIDNLEISNPSTK